MEFQHAISLQIAKSNVLQASFKFPHLAYMSIREFSITGSRSRPILMTQP
uniref:Uncharacterized protein n=1 Tax=Rhizophora mucronata TaxID=61149 RepID=A0A2P2NNQ4_RHIMU